MCTEGDDSERDLRRGIETKLNDEVLQVGLGVCCTRKEPWGGIENRNIPRHVFSPTILQCNAMQRNKRDGDGVSQCFIVIRDGLANKTLGLPSLLGKREEGFTGQVTVSSME